MHGLNKFIKIRIAYPDKLVHRSVDGNTMQGSNCWEKHRMPEEVVPNLRDVSKSSFLWPRPKEIWEKYKVNSSDDFCWASSLVMDNRMSHRGNGITAESAS